jgi:hypothetical protein
MEGLILGALTAVLLRQVVLPVWVALRTVRG